MGQILVAEDRRVDLKLHIVDGEGGRFGYHGPSHGVGNAQVGLLHHELDQLVGQH